MFEPLDFVNKLKDQFLTIGETYIPTSYVTTLTELVWNPENTLQFRILLLLVVWLLLNLCLIRTAWNYYSSDVHSILTSQGRSQSVPRERPRRDTDNEHMKRE